MSKQRHAALRRQSTVLRITKSLARLTLPLVPLRIYNPVYAVRRYGETIRDLWRYRTMDGAEPIRITNLRPCIFDKTSTSEGGSEYLYQDTWAAGKIFLHKPAFHVDVASTIYLVTIVSQFTKTLSIDFRPLLVDLPNLLCLGADMCSLPLENDSLESLSSLSVVEHIGLGRYGDPLNPKGTDQACAELARVLKPQGNLYVAVPVEGTPAVHFNAHRTFSPEAFCAKFPGLQLLEARFALASGLVELDEWDALKRPYAYGCFHLTKPSH